MSRSTHTFAELEVSPSAYDEIADKLRDVGYDHAFIGDAIDMHGIGLVREEVVQRRYPCGCVTCICEDPDRCHECGARSCGQEDCARSAESRGGGHGE